MKKFWLTLFCLAATCLAFPAHAAEKHMPALLSDHPAPETPPEASQRYVSPKNQWLALSETRRKEIVTAWLALDETIRPPFPVFRDSALEPKPATLPAVPLKKPAAEKTDPLTKN